MEMVATCFVPATSSAAAGISTTRCSAANIICRPSFLGSPTTARVRRIRSCELSRERMTTATLQDHGFSFSPEDFSGKMEKLVQSMNADHDHRRNRAGVITGLSLAGDGGGDSGCPVKRVFSSTVFIIGVVQSFVLRLREVLFYQDLEQIIRHVQSELHTSFVWLFQSIFSHTPTLMVYLLIFLANFTVFSIYKNPVFPAAAATVTVSEAPDASKQSFSQFDRQIPKSIFHSAGRTASIGGGDGGGKPPPVAGAMEDGEDGWSLHEGRRQLSLTAREDSVGGDGRGGGEDDGLGPVSDAWDGVAGEVAARIRRRLRRVPPNGAPIPFGGGGGPRQSPSPLQLRPVPPRRPP